MRSIKSAKIVALVVAIMFLFSSVAMAALPENTVLLGNKAYSFELLNNQDYVEELQTAASNAGDVMYYNIGGEWRHLDSSLSDPAVPVSDIPVTEVEYTDAEGNTTTVNLQDSDELEVVSVSAIDNTGVEVVITALEADKLDAEIDIFDNEGNKVAVKPVDIAAGDTTVFFEFVTPFAADYEFKGVWKIGGIEIDFDLKAKLDAFVAAVGNQIALNKALADLGIENVKVENMKAYADAQQDFLDELEENEVELTVEAIQAWINEVNEEVEKATGEAERKAAAVKAVKEALELENDVLLLAALEEHFERVNPEWFGINEGYKAKITDQSFNLEFDTIQEAIDEVNQKAVAEAYDKAFKSLDAKDVAAARTLANNYLSDEEEIAEDAGISIREFANDHLDVIAALIEVNEATTPNILKRALVKLDELDTKLVEKYGGISVDGHSTFGDEKAFDIETVKDEYLKAYIDAIKEAKKTEKNQRKDIQVIINGVNQAAEDAQSKINNRIVEVNVFVTDREHDGKTSGKTWLLGYSVKIQLAADQEFKNAESVVAELYKGKELLGKMELRDPSKHTGQVIWGTIDVYGDYVSTSWKHEWYGELTDRPNRAVATVKFEDGVAVKELETLPNVTKETVKPFYRELANRAETVEEMDAALLKLAEIGNNEYLNIPKADRLFVAEKVLEARNGEDDKKFATYDALAGNDGALTNAIRARNVALDRVNKLNEDSKIADVIAALELVDPEGFAKMSVSDKADIAEAFFNSLFEDGEFVAPNFRTLAAVKAAAGL